MAGKSGSSSVESLVTAPRKFGVYLASRIFAYNLLKRAYIEEPTKEFINLLKEEALLDVFPHGVTDGAITDGVELVGSYFNQADALEDAKMDDLVADYTNLFIGPGKLPAPPWESVYRSKDRLTFQEETIQVRHMFYKYQLESSKIHKEPDDHVALELDFMGHLSTRILDEAKKKEKSWSQVKKLILAQKDFLNEHMLKWLPKFSDDVVTNSRTDFYRGFGKILIGYLRVESKELAELAKVVRHQIRQEKKLKVASG